jgi:hypothetical protein
MRRSLGGYKEAMISSDESQATLEKLLAEARFSREAPRLSALWTAFRRFTHIPVDCADDGFLCQWGTYASAPDVFEFDLTRQYAFEEDGEYSGMQQLHCTLAFPMTVGAGVESGNCWASEHPSIDDFLSYVESSPAFQAARAADLALSSTILLEDV